MRGGSASGSGVEGLGVKPEIHKVVSEKKSRLGRSRNGELQDEAKKRRGEVADHDPDPNSLVATGDERTRQDEHDLHEALQKRTQ